MFCRNIFVKALIIVLLNAFFLGAFSIYQDRAGADVYWEDGTCWHCPSSGGLCLPTNDQHCGRSEAARPNLNADHNKKCVAISENQTDPYSESFRYNEELKLATLKVGRTRCSAASTLLKKLTKDYCLKMHQAEMDPSNAWCDEAPENNSACLVATCSNGHEKDASFKSQYRGIARVRCGRLDVLAFSLVGRFPNSWTYDKASTQIQFASSGKIRDVTGILRQGSSKNSQFANHLVKRYSHAAKFCVGGNTPEFIVGPNVKAYSSDMGEITKKIDEILAAAQEIRHDIYSGLAPPPRSLDEKEIHLEERSEGIAAIPGFSIDWTGVDNSEEEFNPYAEDSKEAARDLLDGFGD